MTRRRRNNTPYALVTEIKALSHEGRGIAHYHDKAQFIEGVLPGERVTLALLGKHRVARILQIDNASKHRVTPPCVYADVCGGCSLQHVRLEKQLEIKQDMLLNHLRHFGQVTPSHILPPLSAKQHVGYRRKARLAVKYVTKKGRLFIGFHEKNGRKIADLTNCSVLDSRISKQLIPLQQRLERLSIKRAIPQIEVAVGDDKVALVVRHLQAMTQADRSILTDFCRQNNYRLYSQAHGPDSIVQWFPVGGDDNLHYRLPDFNLTLSFHPSDFIQVNGLMNQLLVKQVVRLFELNPLDHVLDLFCGLGNFTLPLASQCAKATGIELSAQMVQRAIANSTMNHIDNAQFFPADLNASSITGDWTRKPISKILLDPPRAGALSLVQGLLPTLQAKRIIYVSCNPATLGRDAGILVNQHGYELSQAGVVDMFPHTQHVEAIAVLDKVGKK